MGCGVPVGDMIPVLTGAPERVIWAVFALFCFAKLALFLWRPCPKQCEQVNSKKNRANYLFNIMNYSFQQFYRNFTSQNYGNGARFSFKKILLNSSKLPTLPFQCTGSEVYAMSGCFHSLLSFYQRHNSYS